MNTDNLSAIAKTRIRRPPASVFAAFASASAMSKFWFTRRDDGLKKGESVSWFIGSGEDAISFDVRVKELSEPDKIVIEWVGHDGKPTQVTWLFEETEEGDTILTIEESGFTGSSDAIVARALDSTGGFNQVIIAAKALIEYGVELNVVADHV
ncbi:MAG: SRPBCC domain-containing protein [Gammaproteobacteria bacterium]|nr:SRPBCC domain-containing protein [Gammaproteobacteria bacterium]MDH3375322.1 SRPBCC domain-containing protein [Gammaproteobacteria bacterium]MDH3408945.1 SRPBCC domain-containing protein [Gammaproteobacteria bacterium]MDH3552754.1 SRPBCC domain-containing protein [Gammaproteobacteria bacterium]